MALFAGPHDIPYGEPQGETPGGIVAYSNGTDHFFSGERNFDGEIMTGFKYQCVEFARRWLLDRKGLYLPDVAWAAHIFEMTEVERCSDAHPVRMVAVKNGTEAKPEADTLLIFPTSEAGAFGHVAAIVEVGEGFIRIADQNSRFHKWAGNYSEEIPVVYDAAANTYTIKPAEESVPLGWMTFPDTPNRDPSVPLTFADKYHRPTYPAYSLTRKTFKPIQPDGPWLDASVPHLKKFIDTFGLDFNRSRMDEAESNYYEMNMELMLACVRAGRQCHDMMIRATERVLNDDALLARFGVDKVFWPRIRESFKTQKYAISGRFDFVVDAQGKELKMLEYNADSASTLLECGVVQEHYARAVGIAEGSRSSGFRLEALLHKAWKDVVAAGVVPAGSKVHFCVDKDDEEEYTALFMISAAKAAGLQTELNIKFDNFKFDEEGRVTDQEGTPIKTVWKTWAWETAISDYHAAQKERGADYKGKPGDTVRLCDLVLGNDPNVHVFEPLWKVIPSNKAILPVVWEMNKGHVNLLRSEWEVDDDLRKSGYVRKPIVGRTGMNITVVKPGGEEAAKSEGKFSDRDMIYQELFELPKRDDYFAILGGWMLGAYYAGTGLREDKTIITNVESPFSAIRIPVNYDPNKKQ